MASRDLVSDLNSRLPKRSVEEDIADQVVALGRSHRADERAWAMVNIASILRRAEHHAAALRILDAAIELQPGARPELAIYTCAAAVHCDQDDYATARKVAEGARDRAVDERLLRVLGRIYWALYKETREDLFAAEANRSFELADQFAEPEPTDLVGT